MSVLSRPLRLLVLLAAGLLSGEAFVSHASAATPASTVAGFERPQGESADGRSSGQPKPTVLLGSLSGQILGNRSRMIQMAFIGFAIGIAILVTATRKH